MSGTANKENARAEEFKRATAGDIRLLVDVNSKADMRTKLAGAPC